MITTQRDNNAGGDIVGRDKFVYAPIQSPIIPAAPLNALYAKLRANLPADENVLRIIEELQHYSARVTDGDVRGLAEKFADANRAEMLSGAEFLKQKATKLVMRLQTSPVAQAVITMVLGKIYTDFGLYVVPAIQADASRQDIDRLIGDCVIGPAIGMLGDNDLLLTQSDVMGLLYFLGGNCHIRWDKC